MREEARRRRRGMSPEEREADRVYHARKSKDWRANNPRIRPPAEAAFAARLWARFRMRVAEYEALLRAQNGVCAICGNEEGVAGRRLAVDHCHATGKIRGLLCALCNTGIGKLGDSSSALRRAVEYLERHECAKV